MKQLIVLLAFLVAGAAQASGKISITPTYHLANKQTYPVVGLSIYEKIAGPFYLNSYTGAGAEYSPANQTDYTWMTSKHAIDLHINRFTISAGIGFNHVTPGNTWDNTFFGKLSLQLW